MKIAGVIFLMAVMAIAVVAYLSYGIAVLFTHQTIGQAIAPLLIGALILAAIVWALLRVMKQLTAPRP